MPCFQSLSPAQGIEIRNVLIGVPAAGILLELAAKNINKETHPILRSLLETVAKIIQIAIPVFLTSFLAFIFGSNIFPGVVLTIGSVMILTHILNGIAENTNNEKFKNVLNIADRVVSCASKVINTAIAILVAFGEGPLFAGIAVVIGGLSAVTLLKQDVAEVKQPSEKSAIEAVRV